MNERIKQLRKELGITQDDFGKKLGLARNSIANYEIGRRIPTNAVITSICREFNVNEEWLRTGFGDMFNIKTDDFVEISVAIDRNDPKARQAIIDYWNLSEQDKKLFWAFMDTFIKK